MDLGAWQQQPTFTLSASHLQLSLYVHFSALQSIFVSGQAQSFPVLLDAELFLSAKEAQQVPELELALGPSTLILERQQRFDSL